MMKRCALALGICGICGMFAASSASASRDTAQYTSLTVFGDSLVDAGNFYLASSGTVPDPAYGFFEHRFTNGYDYPDLISLQLFGTPTTPSLLGGNNFGIASARIIDTGDFIPDLAGQIARYVATGKAVDPNGLYILNFGANDVFGASGIFGSDPANFIGGYADVSSYLKAAAEQYVAGVKTLADLGVRNILMTDFPLADNPLTTEANAYLKDALGTLHLDAGVDLFTYSLSDLNTRVVSDPSTYGLDPLDTVTSCIAAGAQANDCRGYLYFDGVHPVAAIQKIGFEEMDERFNLTASVPEPASWIMMIAGFGAVAAAMRYRRRTVTVSYV